MGSQSLQTSPWLLLFKLFKYLSLRRKYQLGLSLLLMLFSGLAEVVSLGAVLPFLTLISNPQDLMANHSIKKIVETTDLINASNIVLVISAMFALLALFSSSLRLLNIWVNGRLSAAVGSDLSETVFRRFLNESYRFHVQNNSSDLIATTVNHVSGTVNAFLSILNLTSSLIIAVFILTGLAIVSPIISATIIPIFGILYFSLGFFSRKKLDFNSKRISIAASL